MWSVLSESMWSVLSESMWSVLSESMWSVLRVLHSTCAVLHHAFRVGVAEGGVITLEPLHLQDEEHQRRHGRGPEEDAGRVE
jgi:hypothetical protein